MNDRIFLKIYLVLFTMALFNSSFDLNLRSQHKFVVLVVDALARWNPT